MGIFEVGLNAFCIMILLQAYGGQGVECGSLNVIGLHNLLARGTLGRYGLVKVGVTLLKQVYHCRAGL